jgi:hypothetical protein
MKCLARLTLLCSALLVSACGTTMTTNDFADMTPTLVLEDYFQGETFAYGLFEDRFGNIRNQFTVTIDGHWDGEMLTLDEDFIYANGETEYRKWEILKTGENTYRGTTQQIIGVAHGKTEGNSFHWTYKFKLKVGDDIWDVKFDDWMFLQADGVLLNKARVYRWGVKIGTVFLSFTKNEAALGASAQRDRAVGLRLAGE